MTVKELNNDPTLISEALQKGLRVEYSSYNESLVQGIAVYFARQKGVALIITDKCYQLQASSIRA